MVNQSFSVPATTYLGDGSLQSSFLFEVDGVEVGYFAEVTGMDMSVEMNEIREGGNNEHTWKVPGRISWSNIILKRGITDANFMFEWVSKTAGEGFSKNMYKLTKHTGAITIMGPPDPATGALKRLRAFNLRDIFPVKWVGPSFNVTDSTILQETIEIAHHGFTVETFA